MTEWRWYTEVQSSIEDFSRITMTIQISLNNICWNKFALNIIKW